MEKSKEQKVEELSKKVGGRFRLTSLIQKRMREYHLGGRAFMPDVKNLDELFGLVLGQIEDGQIELEEASAQPLSQQPLGELEE